MARALLKSSVASVVSGYDKSISSVQKFFEEAKQVGKGTHGAPSSLSDAVSRRTDFVILSLVNEAQCTQICLGDDEPNLLSIMPKGSCIIVTSTVTGKSKRISDILETSIRSSEMPDCDSCGA